MGYTHHRAISVTEGGYATGVKGSESVVVGTAYNASATWNPANILVGAMESVDVTVTGAALGDFVLVSASIDTVDLTLTAQVTAANTVTATLANNTAGAVNLASFTLYVRVLSKS
mgnify:CR=1 FL=1